MNFVLMVISITLIAGNSFAGRANFQKYAPSVKKYTAKEEAEIARSKGAPASWVDHRDFKNAEGKKLAILESKDGGTTGELFLTSTNKDGKVTETLYSLDETATIRGDDLDFKKVNVKIGIPTNPEEVETGVRVVREFRDAARFDYLTKESDLVAREINGVNYSISKVEREYYFKGGVSEGSSVGEVFVKNQDERILVDFDIGKQLKWEIPKSAFDGEVLRANVTKHSKSKNAYSANQRTEIKEDYYRLSVITVNKKNEVVNEVYELPADAAGLINNPKRVIKGTLNDDAIKKMGLLVETNAVPARAASKEPVRNMKVEDGPDGVQ